MPKTNWYFKSKIKKNHNQPDHNLKFHLCVYIYLYFLNDEHMRLPLWQSSTLAAEPYTQFLSCWLSIICAFEGASVFKVQTISLSLSLSLSYIWAWEWAGLHLGFPVTIKYIWLFVIFFSTLKGLHALF